MNCPLKKPEPNCQTCEYGKDALCDYPFSWQRPPRTQAELEGMRVKNVAEIAMSAMLGVDSN